MLKKELDDVLETLTDREERVLRLRFGLEDGRTRTLEEVGKEFDAVISSVTSFGLFCELENTCEGFIPIEILGDGFKFREETLTLGRGHKQYKLGQLLRIRITDANVLRRRIYMEPVE